jgi:hypothetical protein
MAKTALVSSQQSLVEIGSVVSEKIFFNYIPPFSNFIPQKFGCNWPSGL